MDTPAHRLHSHLTLLDRTYLDVHRERQRAHEKHAERGSMERVPWNSERWLPVVTEELGEVARVLCERNLGTYKGTDGLRRSRDDLRGELVQTAAMVCAWIAAIDADPEMLDATPLRADVGCTSCAALGELCDDCAAAEEATWD